MRLLLTILLCIGSTQAFAIEFTGRTEFAQRLALNSSISGRVDQIAVSVGQQVSSGETLLTLVTTGLQASADSARAQVDSLAPAVAKMQTEMEKAQELFDRGKVGYVAAVEEGRQTAGLHPPPVKPGRDRRFPFVADDRLTSSGRP